MSYIVNPALLAKVRSAKITESAQGQQCALRMPGICNHNPATTVWAHLPGIGKSMGSKVSDLHGCYACFACHNAIDRRSHACERAGLNWGAVSENMLRALCESQARLVMAGVVVVPDGKLI